MIPTAAPITRLIGNKPRRPIECSICGALIGSWWQYGVNFYPYMRDCDSTCERLIRFSRGRNGVPREWREFPLEWRSTVLAAGLAELKAHK